MSIEFTPEVIIYRRLIAKKLRQAPYATMTHVEIAEQEYPDALDEIERLQARVEELTNQVNDTCAREQEVTLTLAGTENANQILFDRIAELEQANAAIYCHVCGKLTTFEKYADPFEDDDPPPPGGK